MTGGTKEEKSKGGTKDQVVEVGKGRLLCERLGGLAEGFGW